MSEIEYTAPILTDMAEKWLRLNLPDALIMREFNAAKWGGALIDIVAITKTRIIGIEIKGQGDSLTRLKLQGPSYSLVTNKMYLLCCPELWEKCKKKFLKPQGWIGLVIDGDDLKYEHESFYNREHIVDSDIYHRLPNSPFALCSLLWKVELVHLGQRLRCDVVSSMNVSAIIKTISEICPLREIRQGVIDTLLVRNWDFKNNVSEPRKRSKLTS